MHGDEVNFAFYLTGKSFITPEIELIPSDGFPIEIFTAKNSVLLANLIYRHIGSTPIHRAFATNTAGPLLALAAVLEASPLEK